MDDVIESLRQLDADRDASLHLNDRAENLIQGCLDSGIDTEPEIIRTIMRLGFKPGHIASVLKGGAGLGKRWRLCGKHQYCLNA